MVSFELLAKHFAKETSPAENQLIEDWKQAAGKHLQNYEYLNKIWGIAEKPATIIDEFDTDAAWSKVMKRVVFDKDLFEESIQKATKIRPLFNYKLVSAAVIALLLVSSLVYNFFVYNPILTVVGTEQGGNLVTLEDGTTVRLRKGSVLNYPTQFRGGARQVSLTGEAFFEVAHNAEKPFIIDAGNAAAVKVLGTSFVLKAKGDEAEVAVRTGKVSLSPQDNTSAGVLLTPGKKGKLNKDGRIEVRAMTANDLAWQSGKLYFDNASLKEVIQALNDYYQSNIQLQIPDTTLRTSCKLNATFEEETLEQVLDDLKTLLFIEYDKNADGITIKSIKCDLLD